MAGFMNQGKSYSLRGISPTPKSDFSVSVDCYPEIKRGFLPKWAIGKFTRYINSLEAKGLIKRLGQRVIAVHFIEHNVQNTEKTVHSLEQSVQPTEQSSFTQEERERRIKELRNELAKKKSF